MSCRRIVWPVLAVLTLVPGEVLAHEVGGNRFESPIPLPLLLAGAGATVAITALWLGRSGRPPETAWSYRIGGISATVVRAVRVFAVVVFSLGVLAALAAGFLGPRAAAENFAPAFIWAVWFKGLGLLAMLIGTPWVLLSPWRNVHRLLSRLEGESLSMIDYPDWVGVWPAVVGFVLVVGVAENIVGVPQRPPLTAGLVAAFALVMIIGGVVYGSAWFNQGDAFAVFYRLLGRVAPLESSRTVDGGYEVTCRVPWRGCMRPIDRPGAVTFIVAAVYTVSFDGFTSTPEFQSLLFAARDVLGTGQQTALILYAGGLGFFVVSFLVVAALADITGDRVSSASQSEVRPVARSFAPTVIPIAAAYEFAHYYPYVIRNLGRTVEAVLVFLGTPVDISLLSWLSLPVFWSSQLVLIVGGHIVAVIAAHGVACNRYRSPSKARRGHLPLVFLMVGYTILSLWIVSRPVVSG